VRTGLKESFSGAVGRFIRSVCRLDKRRWKDAALDRSRLVRAIDESGYDAVETGIPGNTGFAETEAAFHGGALDWQRWRVFRR